MRSKSLSLHASADHPERICYYIGDDAARRSGGPVQCKSAFFKLEVIFEEVLPEFVEREVHHVEQWRTDCCHGVTAVETSDALFFGDSAQA